jgi:hypothetical protein
MPAVEESCTDGTHGAMPKRCWQRATGRPRNTAVLRDHLVEQRVTCAVMEATGDYVADATWLANSAPTAWCAARSCHPNRSVSCVT